LFEPVTFYLWFSGTTRMKWTQNNGGSDDANWSFIVKRAHCSISVTKCKHSSEANIKWGQQTKPFAKWRANVRLFVRLSEAPHNVCHWNDALCTDSCWHSCFKTWEVPGTILGPDAQISRLFQSFWADSRIKPHPLISTLIPSHPIPSSHLVKVKLSLGFFKLNTTPWRHIGEWRYTSTHSQPRH